MTFRHFKPAPGRQGPQSEAYGQRSQALEHNSPKKKMDRIDTAQTEMGLRFKDRSLLMRALTHRSYLNENPDFVLEDNQRLEFLGDAVLDFVTAAWLYEHFPEFQEGRLTSLRAALVRTPALAKFAREIKLGDHLFLGKGEEDSGGRAREANLCDAFEALIGALYLDSGLPEVLEMLHPLLRDEAERVLAAELDRDPKSLFQEWSQAERGITPRYRTINASGPDHARTFVVAVYVGDEVYGKGPGGSKQAAARAAAKAALERLRNEGVV
jgi:ribonuclease-3